MVEDEHICEVCGLPGNRHGENSCGEPGCYHWPALCCPECPCLSFVQAHPEDQRVTPEIMGQYQRMMAG